MNPINAVSTNQHGPSAWMIRAMRVGKICYYAQYTSQRGQDRSRLAGSEVESTLSDLKHYKKLLLPYWSLCHHIISLVQGFEHFTGNSALQNYYYVSNTKGVSLIILLIYFARDSNYKEQSYYIKNMVNLFIKTWSKY